MISVFNSEFPSWCGLKINYINGNDFEFSQGITFQIKFLFNKMLMEPERLNSIRIFVKNEKNICKNLTIKLHIEESESFFRKISKYIFGEYVSERYCQIPHIGYNHSLKRFKIVESKEKMSDYVINNKMTVFYTPHKCVLVNRVNKKYNYINNVVYDFYSQQNNYDKGEPEIITVFKNEYDESIWLPTVNYFGEIIPRSSYYINIEEEEIQKELLGEELAKKNLNKLRSDLENYFDYMIIEGKNSNEKYFYKDIIEKSNLICFIDYFYSSKIKFEKKKEYLIKIKSIIDKDNDESSEALNYFIDFEEKIYKKVKNMYINNIVEVIRNLLINKYLQIKQRKFYFYDLSKYEKKRKELFKPIKEEDMIKTIRKHHSIQGRKEQYEKEKERASCSWCFKENEKYPSIYKGDDDSKSVKSKKSESLKTDIEDLNIDKSMIKTPDPSLLNNLQSYEIFYKKLILICQAFPFFINKIEKKEVNEKFNFLYTYYHNSIKSNKSFIYSSIMSFNNAFETLCENLKNSNLDLNEFEVNKGQKNLSLGNIVYPNPNLVNLPFKSNWYERKIDQIKAENIEDRIYKRLEEKAKIKILEGLNIPENKIEEDKKRPLTPIIKRFNSKINFIPKESEEERKKKEKEEDEIKEVELIKKKEEKEEEKEELYSDEEKEDKKEDKDEAVPIIDSEEKSKKLTKKSLDKLKKEDINKSLEKVFRVMEMEDKEDKLLLPSEFSKQFDDYYKQTFDEDRKNEENKGLLFKI